MQLADVDIEYDSGAATVTDAGVGNDDLAGIFVFNGGVEQGLIDGPGVSFDFELPSVPAIPVAGGTVTTAAGGSLTLFGPGLILDVTLQSADIIYTPIPSIVDFVFVGTVGSIDAQNIPFVAPNGIGDPVTITLSTQVDSITAGTTFVTSFTASGTGEIEGPFSIDPDNVIPEPTTLALLALGAAALGRRR
ncbi:MAG: PEP-CTERM sorting domain-containing protein [Planctomycetota bacterium]